MANNHGQTYKSDQMSRAHRPPPPLPTSRGTTSPIPHLPANATATNAHAAGATDLITPRAPPPHLHSSLLEGVERVEGYDYEFLPPADSKYECPICLLVLRGTLQTMCGHRFCSACIHRWLRETGGPKCPVCNEPIDDSQLFPDKFADREIMSFTVYCPHSKAGCPFTLELQTLQNHLDDVCDYVLVPCPNRCSAMLYKKDVDWHCGKECPKRETPCTMCGEKIPTAETEYHKEVCLEQEVACPYCKVHVTRRHEERHISECDRAPTQCVFSPLGCDAKLTRSEVSGHNEDKTQYHLTLIAKALNVLFQYLNIPAQFTGDKGEQRYPLINIGDKSSATHTGIALGTETVNHLSRQLQQLRVSSSGQNTNSQAPPPTLPSRHHHEPAEGSCSDQFISSGLAGQLPSRTRTNIAANAHWPQDSNWLLGGATGRVQSHPASLENASQQPNYVNMPLSDPVRLKQQQAGGGGGLETQVSQTKDAAFNRQLSCEESMRLGVGDASLDLMEKSRQQEASVARQKQMIFELQAKMVSLESRLSEHHQTVVAQKEALAKQEEAMANFEGRNCNGVYIWKIRDFSKLRREAISGQTTVLHSPGFYTSFHGYKLCIRINLNGVDSGIGTHISIFIHFMRGEFDDILEWPFRGKIILTVMDQGENKQHITEVLESKASLAAFQRPQSNRNHKGFGYIEFAPLGLIEQQSYLPNDTLIVKAVVTEI